MSQATTNICRYFAATGNCFYGDHCNYLHILSSEQNPNHMASTLRSTTPQPTAQNIPQISQQGFTKTMPKNQIPCRNVTIYGYCKNIGRGCEYNHDAVTLDHFVNPYHDDQITPQDSTTPTFNPNVGNKATVEEQQSMSSIAESNTKSNENKNETNSSAVYFYPNTVNMIQSSKQQKMVMNHRNQGVPSVTNKTTSSNEIGVPGRKSIQSYFSSEELRKEFMKKTALIYATLDKESNSNINSNSINETSHSIQTNRIKESKIPQSVYKYHNLFPLDKVTNSNVTNTLCGFQTRIYKCQSSIDGLAYVMRKIDGFKLNNEHAFRIGEIWKQLTHPNLVTMTDLFLSKDFGDVNSLFFTYEYFPGAETLERRYSNRINTEYVTNIDEKLVWSYVIQLISAIKYVHSNGLSCRTILPSKVLAVNKYSNRIRVNALGIHDVITYDGGKNILLYQHEDLISLGYFIIFLTTRQIYPFFTNNNSISNPANILQNIYKSLDFIGNYYSNDLKVLVILLLGGNVMNVNMMGNNSNYYNKYGIGNTHSHNVSIEDIAQSSIVTKRLYAELETTSVSNDFMENELYKEYENGRLFRMLVKLGFINERPEFDMDPSWAETGDRYLLKLFRDYLFHQVYEDGSPVIDFAHVVDCLHKLDVGSPEKIVLMSRDEQSILVVSYKDLKRCIQDAFHELQHKKNLNQQFYSMNTQTHM